MTSTAICGSDLHLYQGNFPLPIGYVIGHEPMGIVEEAGPDVTKVKKGDRVVIPFTVACGTCHYCAHDLESQCDNANPHYAPARHYMPYLYEQIRDGRIDPRKIIMHRLPWKRRRMGIGYLMRRRMGV